MPSIKVYLIGSAAVVGTYLLLHFNAWFWLLAAGAALWSIAEYRKEQRANAAARRIEEAELRRIEAAARTAHADAALREEEVETARARRQLIPATYIGAQFSRPEYANLYRVWGNGNSPSVRVAEEAAALPVLAPALPQAANIYTLLPTLDAAQGKILLGYATDGPVWLSVDELLSVAMAGNSGRGKSKALLWLATQLIRSGVTTIFLDGKGDMRRWLSPHHSVAYNGAEIKQSVDAVILEAEWRLRLASEDADATFKPVLVVIDELDLVIGRYDRTLALIEMLTKKTRSVNIHGIYSNQSVPADLVGGVATRGVIVSRICLYCDDEAAQLIGVRKDNGGKALLQLIAPPAPAGLAIARTAAFGWRVVAFPYVPDGAVRWLLDSIPELPPLPPNPNRVSVSTEQAQNSPNSMPTAAHTLTHKAAQVTADQRAYILAHRIDMSASAIAIMLWNDAHKNVIVKQVWQEEGSNE